MESEGIIQRDAAVWLDILAEAHQQLNETVRELTQRSQELRPIKGGAFPLAEWVDHRSQLMLDIVSELEELEEGLDPGLEPYIDWRRAEAELAACKALFRKGRDACEFMEAWSSGLDERDGGLLTGRIVGRTLMPAGGSHGGIEEADRTALTITTVTTIKDNNNNNNNNSNNNNNNDDNINNNNDNDFTAEGEEADSTIKNNNNNNDDNISSAEGGEADRLAMVIADTSTKVRVVCYGGNGRSSSAWRQLGGNPRRFGRDSFFLPARPAWQCFRPCSVVRPSKGIG
ncbi:hypothetical protein CBR_g854 [Chara braunii]|uniref:Uncharacterized protein n=1 Tax=Chara braunii TaxID=69332 RepID=A0A388KCJ7_CHABU|nr:hypothetical protein CBR_g854 [Chara braunii]|eukprot:GBG67726.1 hypothetical protein CBR_g854 [Chara braunii]